MEELLASSMTQNFIPVIDDRDCYIGIVTRRAILNYFCAGRADVPAVRQNSI
jgi:predicted transcriptional regulator